MKKAIKWIVVIVVLAGGGFWWKMARSPGEESSKPTFEPTIVEQRDLKTSVEATGEVQPRNRLDVKPPIAGRLEELLVDEGDEVAKGQILGWISSTERATLLDAALATSKEELAYWEELYKPSPLISPLNGTIIARNFEPGQSIAANDAVVVIADDLIVVANLDETDIGQVKNDQVVEMVLEAYPARAFDGAVEKIAYDAKLVSNVTMYEVDVRPSHVPPFMRSGMTANLEFVIAEKLDALAVPTSAVMGKPGRGTERPAAPRNVVLVASDDPENPTEVEVKVGMSDGSFTEIIEGLSLGDEVLIKNMSFGAKGKAGNNPFMPNMPRGGRR